ncbi:MAG: ureidoglycolate lyase [Alphaproteobacteria bacterium]|nr:ureidoglycolate lyase [Alphaproteobacteria bacterium]
MNDQAMPTPADTDLMVLTQALTADAMAPYGWVLDIHAAFAEQGGREINAGTSRRADMPGPLSLHEADGQPTACVFRASAQTPQGVWRVLERHRLGSQTFVPMAFHGEGLNDRSAPLGVLLVALGDWAPDLATLRAFWFTGQQAFTLKPGTWHHPLIAWRDSDFWVIERGAPEVDCELSHLPRAIRLTGLPQGV